MFRAITIAYVFLLRQLYYLQTHQQNKTPVEKNPCTKTSCTTTRFVVFLPVLFMD